MERKVTLRVLGVDFDQDQTVAIIAKHLDDLIWSRVSGRVRVTLVIDQPGCLVSAAVDVARRIEFRLPGSRC